jgi:hypothetical protein
MWLGKEVLCQRHNPWARGKTDRADLDRICELTSTTLFPSYDISPNLYIKLYYILDKFEPVLYPAFVYPICYREAKESLAIVKVFRSSTASIHPTSLGPKGPKLSQGSYSQRPAACMNLQSHLRWIPFVPGKSKIWLKSLHGYFISILHHAHIYPKNTSFYPSYLILR